MCNCYHFCYWLFPLELRVWPFFWTKFLFTQKCINSMIMKKSHRKSLSFYCCKHFSPVSLLSPIRKWCCKFALPSPKHGFRCVGANINWYKLAQIDWFLWERIVFFKSIHFHYHYFAKDQQWPFIWTNWIHLHPRDALFQVWASWDKDFTGRWTVWDRCQTTGAQKSSLNGPVIRYMLMVLYSYNYWSTIHYISFVIAVKHSSCWCC